MTGSLIKCLLINYSCVTAFLDQHFFNPTKKFFKCIQIINLDFKIYFEKDPNILLTLKILYIFVFF